MDGTLDNMEVAGLHVSWSRQCRILDHRDGNEC
jgi:hypothetical protein